MSNEVQANTPAVTRGDEHVREGGEEATTKRFDSLSFHVTKKLQQIIILIVLLVVTAALLKVRDQPL